MKRYLAKTDNCKTLTLLKEEILENQSRKFQMGSHALIQQLEQLY